jgi:hypothetical protein
MASRTTLTGAPSQPAAAGEDSRATTPTATGGAGTGAAGAAKTAAKAESAGSGAGKTGKRGSGLTKRGKVVAATAAAAGVAAATAAGVAVVKAIRRKRADARVYHIEPKGEDWQVRKDGSERASGAYGTKKEAIAAGRELAQKHEPSRLVIHGGDGSVQRDHSYGESDD